MNDEVKHTPIPWKAKPDDHRNEIDIRSADGMALVVRFSFAGLPGSEVRARTEANAAFIVEAVNNYDRLRAVNADLLAALEAIVDAHDGVDGQTPYPDDWARIDAALMDAGAALARARGENVNA